MKEFKSFIEATRYFADEEKCRQYLEEKRWGGIVRCLRCGHAEVMRLGDGKTYKCKLCRRKFSLTSGTIFESSKLPLSLWFPAIYLITSKWKGISSVQLAKDLGVQQTTAWFIAHRVREMILEKDLGKLGGIVEIDESYVKDGNKHNSNGSNVRGTQGRSLKVKTPVIALKQRNGKVIVLPIPNAKSETIAPIIEEYVKKGATIVTDSCPSYNYLSKGSGYNHVALNHSKGEYVRNGYHTNTVEGFWAYMKQCLHGIHHWVSSKHLWRYCAEWAFKYNTSANAKAKNRGKNFERFDAVMDMFNTRLKFDRLTTYTPDYAIAA